MNKVFGADFARNRILSRLGPVLVTAAATAVYANSFPGAFQFDDIPAIVENPTIRHLWPLGMPLSPPTGGLTVSGRPVLNFSLALNYAASGLHAWSYHALNLLIHIGAALALLGVVRRTLRRLGAANPLGPALAVAAIWAVHPVTTEAVTYVVQRAESLMALFYLLTLYCFVRAVDASNAAEGLGWRHGGARSPERPPRPSVQEKRVGDNAFHLQRPSFGAGWKALGVLCCWLGMGTKEVMVSAPVAVFLYDRIFVAGSWRGAWRARRGFYLCLAAGWIPLVLLVAGTGWDRGGTYGAGVSAGSYWLSQGEAMARYVGLALWPHPLALDYGPPTAPVAVAVVLVALIMAAFGATVVACHRGRPWGFLAGGCFLVLAPTSVMPSILQFVAEHRIYLPLAAAVTAAVLGVRRAADRWRVSAAARRWSLVALLIVVVAGLGAVTVQRNRLYEDELALWLDNVARRPRSAVAQANAGKALLEHGRVTEGMACLLKAVALDPNKPVACYNLGLAYESQQRWDDALVQFTAAANLNPRLYLAEFRAGRLLNRLDRPADAEIFLRHALSVESGFAEARGSLGVSLSLQGRSNEAVAEFEQSLSGLPGQPDIEFDLGLCLGRLGRLPEASQHYAAAVRLDPANGKAQLNLGVTLAELGRVRDALPCFQAAARLLPDSPEAHENLATALDQLGRTAAAVAEYRSALRLRPAYPEAHYNLGNALIHERDLAGARAEFAEALRLKPGLRAAREMLDRIGHIPDEP